MDFHGSHPPHYGSGEIPPYDPDDMFDIPLEESLVSPKQKETIENTDEAAAKTGVRPTGKTTSTTAVITAGIKPSGGETFLDKLSLWVGNLIPGVKAHLEAKKNDKQESDFTAATGIHQVNIGRQQEPVYIKAKPIAINSKMNLGEAEAAQNYYRDLLDQARRCDPACPPLVQMCYKKLHDLEPILEKKIIKEFKGDKTKLQQYERFKNLWGPNAAVPGPIKVIIAEFVRENTDVAGLNEFLSNCEATKSARNMGGSLEKAKENAKLNKFVNLNNQLMTLASNLPAGAKSTNYILALGPTFLQYPAHGLNTQWAVDHHQNDSFKNERHETATKMGQEIRNFLPPEVQAFTQGKDFALANPYAFGGAQGDGKLTLSEYNANATQLTLALAQPGTEGNPSKMNSVTIDMSGILTGVSSENRKKYISQWQSAGKGEDTKNRILNQLLADNPGVDREQARKELDEANASLKRGFFCIASGWPQPLFSNDGNAVKLRSVAHNNPGERQIQVNLPASLSAEKKVEYTQLWLSTNAGSPERADAEALIKGENRTFGLIIVGALDEFEVVFDKASKEMMQPPKAEAKAQPAKPPEAKTQKSVLGQAADMVSAGYKYVSDAYKMTVVKEIESIISDIRKMPAGERVAKYQEQKAKLLGFFPKGHVVQDATKDTTRIFSQAHLLTDSDANKLMEEKIRRLDRLIAAETNPVEVGHFYNPKTNLLTIAASTLSPNRPIGSPLTVFVRPGLPDEVDQADSETLINSWIESASDSAKREALTETIDNTYTPEVAAEIKSQLTKVENKVTEATERLQGTDIKPPPGAKTESVVTQNLTNHKANRRAMNRWAPERIRKEIMVRNPDAQRLAGIGMIENSTPLRQKELVTYLVVLDRAEESLLNTQFLYRDHPDHPVSIKAEKELALNQQERAKFLAELQGANPDLAEKYLGEKAIKKMMVLIPNPTARAEAAARGEQSGQNVTAEQFVTGLNRMKADIEKDPLTSGMDIDFKPMDLAIYGRPAHHIVHPNDIDDAIAYFENHGDEALVSRDRLMEEVDKEQAEIKAKRAAKASATMTAGIVSSSFTELSESLDRLETKIQGQNNWADLDDFDNLKTIRNNLAAIEKNGVPQDQKEQFDDLQKRAITLWNTHVTSTESKTKARTPPKTTPITTATTSTKGASLQGVGSLFKSKGAAQPQKNAASSSSPPSPTRLVSSSVGDRLTGDFEEALKEPTGNALAETIEEKLQQGSRDVISDAEWYGPAAAKQEPRLPPGVVKGDLVESGIQLYRRSPELQARLDAKAAAQPAKELENFQNRYQAVLQEHAEATPDGKQKLTIPAGAGALALTNMKIELDAMYVNGLIPSDKRSEYNNLYKNIVAILMYRAPESEQVQTQPAAAPPTSPLLSNNDSLVKETTDSGMEVFANPSFTGKMSSPAGDVAAQQTQEEEQLTFAEEGLQDLLDTGDETYENNPQIFASILQAQMSQVAGAIRSVSPKEDLSQVELLKDAQTKLNELQSPVTTASPRPSTPPPPPPTSPQSRPTTQAERPPATPPPKRPSAPQSPVALPARVIPGQEEAAKQNTLKRQESQLEGLLSTPRTDTKTLPSQIEAYTAAAKAADPDYNMKQDLLLKRANDRLAANKLKQEQANANVNAELDNMINQVSQLKSPPKMAPQQAAPQQGKMISEARVRELNAAAQAELLETTKIIRAIHVEGDTPAAQGSTQPEVLQMLQDYSEGIDDFKDPNKRKGLGKSDQAALMNLIQLENRYEKYKASLPQEVKQTEQFKKDDRALGQKFEATNRDLKAKAMANTQALKNAETSVKESVNRINADKAKNTPANAELLLTQMDILKKTALAAGESPEKNETYAAAKELQESVMTKLTPEEQQKVTVNVNKAIHAAEHKPATAPTPPKAKTIGPRGQLDAQKAQERTQLVTNLGLTEKMAVKQQQLNNRDALNAKLNDWSKGGKGVTEKRREAAERFLAAQKNGSDTVDLWGLNISDIKALGDLTQLMPNLKTIIISNNDHADVWQPLQGKVKVEIREKTTAVPTKPAEMKRTGDKLGDAVKETLSTEIIFKEDMESLLSIYQDMGAMSDAQLVEYGIDKKEIPRFRTFVQECVTNMTTMLTIEKKAFPFLEKYENVDDIPVEIMQRDCIMDKDTTKLYFSSMATLNDTFMKTAVNYPELNKVQNQMMENIQRQAGTLSLIKPMQRMLKYSLLYREELKQLPQDNPMYKETTALSDVVTANASAVNEKTKQQQHNALRAKLQESPTQNLVGGTTMHEGKPVRYDPARLEAYKDLGRQLTGGMPLEGADGKSVNLYEAAKTSNFDALASWAAKYKVKMFLDSRTYNATNMEKAEREIAKSSPTPSGISKECEVHVNYLFDNMNKKPPQYLPSQYVKKLNVHEKEIQAKMAQIENATVATGGKTKDQLLRADKQYGELQQLNAKLSAIKGTGLGGQPVENYPDDNDLLAVWSGAVLSIPHEPKEAGAPPAGMDKLRQDMKTNPALQLINSTRSDLKNARL